MLAPALTSINGRHAWGSTRNSDPGRNFSATIHGGHAWKFVERLEMPAMAAPKLGYLGPLFTPSSRNAAIFWPRRTTRGDRRVVTEDEPQREVGAT